MSLSFITNNDDDDDDDDEDDDECSDISRDGQLVTLIVVEFFRFERFLRSH